MGPMRRTKRRKNNKAAPLRSSGAVFLSPGGPHTPGGAYLFIAKAWAWLTQSQNSPSSSPGEPTTMWVVQRPG